MLRFRPKKELRIYIIAAVIALALIIAVLIRNTGETCSQVNGDVKTTLANSGRTIKNYSTLYNKLQKTDSCKSKSSNGSANVDTTSFEYYYNRATVGYRLGKISEAQADAKTALEISKRLPENEAKSQNHLYMERKLHEVVGGVY